MESEIDTIRKIINDWFSFKLYLSVADIMPYLVYLVEEHDRLLYELETKQQNQK